MVTRTIQRFLIVLLVFVASGLLPGRAPAFAASRVSSARITGSAIYRERIALTPAAVFEATLEEASRSGAAAKVIKRVHRKDPGQVPIAFEIPYDPRRIDSRRTYVLRASIYEDGRLRFASTQAYPVLTHGHGRKVMIRMRRTSGDVGKGGRAGAHAPAPHPHRKA
jgi:putative lipoprotein